MTPPIGTEPTFGSGLPEGSTVVLKVSSGREITDVPDVRDKPAEGLTATIYYGRPGTPMPPWKQFMTEAEAAWIVDQLMREFPK